LAAAPALQVRILAMGGDDLWEATETVLTPIAPDSPLYQFTKVQSLVTAGNCGDLFQNFQARPLDVMNENGYVPDEMRERLLKLKDSGIKSKQLLLITLFSDITPAQASELFGPEGVPKGRLLKRIRNPSGEELLRVSRGTVYAVRGYELIGKGANGFQLSPLPVPWELGAPLPSGLTRPLDRTQVKALIEIGRVHAEKGALPGDFDLLMRTLMTTLENQHHALGLNPDEVVLSGHFLDPQHARFFTHSFPLRILTAELQAQLEANPRELLSHYLELPLPKGSAQWKEHPDTVTFGSLAEAVRQFSPESISSLAAESKSHGRLRGADALHLIRDFASTLQDRFTFVGPDESSARPPLVMLDWGTPLLKLKQNLVLRRYGFTSFEDPNFAFFKNRFQQTTLAAVPDFLLGPWQERSLFIPIAAMPGAKNGAMEPIPSLMITNLDAQLAREYPQTYLSMVLRSVYDWLRAKFQSLPPEQYAEVLAFTNQQRKTHGLASLRELDHVSFLASFPLKVASSDDVINQQLADLGGVQSSAFKMGFHFPKGPVTTSSVDLGFQGGAGVVYDFDGQRLMQIEQTGPGEANARNRLRREMHTPWQSLLQSTYF
jgi:hypothetical protein